MRDAPTRLRPPARSLLLALVTGALTAAGVGAFKLLVAGVEWLAFGWAGEGFGDLPWPLVLGTPVAGGLVVGLALHFARTPEDPGHGVTEVLEAATLDEEEFPDRNVPLHASLAGVSLGTGASLGPEDPSVEIWGGVGEAVGVRAGVDHQDVRALVAAGAAGGISALVLAPVAAMAFTVEVFGVRPVSRTFLMVVLAALVAFLGMRWMVPHPSPVAPAVELPLAPGLLLCLGLGVAGGALSALAVRFTYRVRHVFVAWRRPQWLKPAVGGLALGMTGLALPELLGIGYGTMERVLGEEGPGPLLLGVLLLGKIATVAISFGTGFRGGFFAPAFFVGAVAGVLYGEGAAAVLPGVGASAGAYGTAGMAAALAGLVHAPLTAALVVASLAGDPASLPFLLVASLAAYWMARRLEPGSIYTYPLRITGRPVPHPRGDFRSPRDLQ